MQRFRQHHQCLQIRKLDIHNLTLSEQSERFIGQNRTGRRF
jgi:hypothetical protein